MNKEKLKKVEFLTFVVSKSACCKYCQIKFKCNEEIQKLKNENNDDKECYLMWFNYLKKRI